MKITSEKQSSALVHISLVRKWSWRSWRPISFLFISSLFISLEGMGQSACPSLTVSPDASVCNNCTTLSSTVQGTVATTSYTVSSTAYSPFSYTTGTNVLVNIDDHWSSAITIPFCFQFYGNTYTQCVIGSNAVLSFNLANAGGYNTWAISAAIPSATPSDLLNCILAPWHDIDPSITSNSTPEINWSVQGTAPCRAFIVNWTNVSMYSGSCNAQLATSQVVLYETTNIIDINIQAKPLCSTWNSGAAIEGIQDATGSQAVVVPGRNYPAQWTATNDGQRFTPAGAPEYTLTWYSPPGTAIGTTPTISVCPTSTTTYTATLVNNTCNGPITISAPVTVTVCGGPPCSFIAHGDTVCIGATILLSAGNVTNATYKWRGPNGFTSLVQNPSITNATLAQTGWYYVTDTIPSCTHTDSVFVKVNSISVANAGADQTICIGSTVTLAGAISGSTAGGIWSGGSGTYNPNNMAPTSVYTPNAAEETAGSVTLTYTPNDTTSTCAGVSDHMMITISPSPTANAGSVQYVCPGSAISLAGSIGGGAAGGTWSGGTGSYSPDNTTLNAVYTPSAAEYTTDSVSLTLTTNDPPGSCTFSSSKVTFHFYQNPRVNFTVDTAGGCPVHCTGFTNSSVIISGNDSITSWLWDFGDGSSGSDLTAPSHCFPQPGFYDVNLIATSNHGCKTALVKAQLVHVFSIPVAKFDPFPNPASMIEPTVTFSNQSSSDVNYWHWNFGDSTTLASTTSSPAHCYPDSVSGSYLVTLIVHNTDGCSDTVKREITIGPGFTFYIPNAFSPNGNGINDHFFGTGTGIIKYELWIFDRWGNMIFHTDELNGKWDGKDKNGKEIVLSDVYVWKVELTDVYNKKHNYVGPVTIVR